MALDTHLKREHDLSLNLLHLFACEKEPKKRAFIMEQHDPPPRHMFTDVIQLQECRAHCDTAQKSVIVPSCGLLVAGFSCKSRSKANNRRKEFSSCLQRETPCETTDTFMPLQAYISHTQPTAIILENVEELCDVSAETGVSDAEWIQEHLQREGYWSVCLKLDALAFGSIARRRRLYIVAARLAPGVNKESISGFVNSVLNSMDISGSTKIQDFLNLSDSPQTKQRSSKAARGDMKYKDEHYQFFEQASLVWPAPLAEWPMIDTSSMTERQAEVAIYVHAVFPPDASSAGAPQFCDLNPSLCRIVGPMTMATPRNPWSVVIPTLTSASTILARYFVESDTKACALRLLSGEELMSVVGWTDWKVLVVAMGAMSISYSMRTYCPPIQIFKCKTMV